MRRAPRRLQSIYMARGFSCPNCHTWFEGQGNHPKCPLCGTRASPRDLLEQRPVSPPPRADAGPATGLPYADYETPAAPPAYEEAPDYEVAHPAGGGEQPRQGADSESLGNRLSPLIGGLIFLAIIASQVCRALTDSE